MRYRVKTPFGYAIKRADGSVAALYHYTLREIFWGDLSWLGRQHYVRQEADHRQEGSYFLVGVTGPLDASPVHHNEDGYDSRCSCCYLNAAHTLAYHKQRLGE
jgi:hypothetical protein